MSVRVSPMPGGGLVMGSDPSAGAPAGSLYVGGVGVAGSSWQMWLAEAGGLVAERPDMAGGGEAAGQAPRPPGPRDVLKVALDRPPASDGGAVWFPLLTLNCGGEGA